MGRWGIGAAVATLLVAGCGLSGPSGGPSLPTFATSVETSFVNHQLNLIVTPWPLDATVAFLCVDKPGNEFTVAHPVPAAAAQCVPMDVSATNDRLVASVVADRIAGFRLTRPAYLAIAGSRGAISASTVLTVVLLGPSASPG